MLGIADITLSLSSYLGLSTDYGGYPDDVDPGIGFVAKDKITSSGLQPTMVSLWNGEISCLYDGDIRFLLSSKYILLTSANLFQIGTKIWRLKTK